MYKDIMMLINKSINLHQPIQLQQVQAIVRLWNTLSSGSQKHLCSDMLLQFRESCIISCMHEAMYIICVAGM